MGNRWKELYYQISPIHERVVAEYEQTKDRIEAIESSDDDESAEEYELLLKKRDLFKEISGQFCMLESELHELDRLEKP